MEINLDKIWFILKEILKEMKFFSNIHTILWFRVNNLLNFLLIMQDCSSWHSISRFIFCKNSAGIYGVRNIIAGWMRFNFSIQFFPFPLFFLSVFRRVISSSCSSPKPFPLQFYHNLSFISHLSIFYFCFILHGIIIFLINKESFWIVKSIELFLSFINLPILLHNNSEIVNRWCFGYKYRHCIKTNFGKDNVTTWNCFGNTDEDGKSLQTDLMIEITHWLFYNIFTGIFA